MFQKQRRRCGTRKASRNFLLNGAFNKQTQTPLPLQEVQVECNILDSFITLQILQFYKNLLSEPIEVEYQFPISSDSAVTNLQVQFEDGTIINGIIEEKEEAKEQYGDTISSGNTAIMASYNEDYQYDRMTLNIGNVQPNHQIQVMITYVGLCSVEQQNQVLYIPNQFFSIQEVQQNLETLTQSKNQQKAPQVPCNVFINCDIKSKNANIQLIECQSHPIIIEEISPFNKKIKLDPSKQFLTNTDFVLTFQTENFFNPKFVLQRSQEQGDQIAGCISFVPQMNVKSEGIGEFIFILDRSGSMIGKRFEMAKNAAILFVQSLPYGSKFNIVSFGSDYELMFPESQIYNDQTLEIAVALLTSIKANMGGTEILNPLKAIFSWPFDPHFPRSLFLLTDGEVSNPQQIIGLIEEHSEECRVHSFGIGEGVSEQLINESAQAGRGKAYFIKDGENIQSKVIESLEKATEPALVIENID